MFGPVSMIRREKAKRFKRKVQRGKKKEKRKKKQ
jgi:hypothetical protein